MQMSEQVIEVLNYLCEKLGMTIDWTSANVLPYLNTLCEKYVRYEIATSVVWLVLGVIGAVIFAVLCRKYWKRYCDAKPYSDKDDMIALFVLSLICIIPFAAVIISQTIDIIECCTIPEKVIFEYIQAAMK